MTFGPVLAHIRRPAAVTNKVTNVGNEAIRDRLHRALRGAWHPSLTRAREAEPG